MKRLFFGVSNQYVYMSSQHRKAKAKTSKTAVSKTAEHEGNKKTVQDDEGGYFIFGNKMSVVLVHADKLDTVQLQFAAKNISYNLSMNEKTRDWKFTFVQSSLLLYVLKQTSSGNPDEIQRLRRGVD